MKGRFAVGVALGAVFLYLSLRQVNLEDTWERLRQVRYYYLGAFLLINVLIIWIRAVRWGYLLRPIHVLPAKRLLAPMCIGLMANFVFPARAGEFVRAYLVGKEEKVSKSAAFATVVVERLFDGLAIISFLGLAPFFFHPREGTVAEKFQWVGLAVFLFYVSVLAVLLVLSHHREALSAFLSESAPARRWKLVGRIFEVVRKFTDGLAVLKSRGEVIVALVLSLLIWVLAGVCNYLMMHSVGLYLPLYAAFFLVVVQSFGVMVPSPGFVGSYQYAHIIALSVYGVADSDALGLAILIHSGYFLLFVGAGLFFLSREHLGWRELKKVSTEKD